MRPSYSKKLLAVLLTCVGALSVSLQPSGALGSAKASIAVELPRFVTAGVPTLITVTVCPPSNRSGFRCGSEENQYVRLRVNGRTLYSPEVPVDQVVVFKWVAPRPGKYSLVFAYGRGEYGFNEASATEQVYVSKAKPYVKPTAYYCVSKGCGKSTPSQIFVSDQSAEVSLVFGSNKAVGLGRTARLLWLNEDHKWVEDAVLKTSWDTNFSAYAATFSLYNSEDDAACSQIPGQTWDVLYRFVIPGTPTLAPSGSSPFKLTFRCK